MRSKWAVLIVCLAAVLLVATGVWGLWLFGPPPWQACPTMLELNNRGVGYMEQYNYPEAEKLFRQVVEECQSHGWLQGRINLAIAMLNQDKPASLKESTAILRGILEGDWNAPSSVKYRHWLCRQCRENGRPHPNNPYAHFCLAIILNQTADPEAAEHFEAVTRIDPTDPHAWYWLGKCREQDDPELARNCLEKAAELDPYLSSAVYSLGRLKYLSGEEQEGKALLDRHRALQDSKWDNDAKIEYGRMGRYAEVIGRDPRPPLARTGPLPGFRPVENLQVKLADGTRWANSKDFQGDTIAELRGRVQKRFGVTTATFDYNGDGKTDMLLLGAVVRDGHVEDLLLRNDGNWQFTDVTAEVGLAGPRPSLGCAIGDFDNDGSPDLFITCAGPNHLFRNVGGKFQDITEAAGITGEPMISLAAAFVDLDQDGDLDLYVANYARLDDAATAFTSALPPAVPNFVFRNDSVAKPRAAGEASEKGGAALEPMFHQITEPQELVAGEHTVAIALGDFDCDRDIDLLLIQDAAPAVLVLNDRVMSFHREPLAEALLPAGVYNGAVAADFDKDGKPDLFVISPDGPCRLLLNRADRKGTIRFVAGVTNAEKLRQGRLIDIDLDGWFDFVGQGQTETMLLHNQGGRLVQVKDAFGRSPQDRLTESVLSVVTDLDGDGPADFFELRSDGPRALRNLSGYHWLKLQLAGVQDAGNKLNTNRDATAAHFTVHASDLYVEADQANRTAGLGQAHEPWLIGLGTRKSLDVVRVRWPDGQMQAELERDVDQLITVGQVQRAHISCPLLFTWNGSRFEYIADFLGVGGLGYLLEPGVYAEPDRDEAVKIEPGKLVPNDGRFVLKIAEPMDEVTYLDRVTLVAVDHPAELTVFPDERFAPPVTRPDWRLFAYRDPIVPVAATDSRGHDVTEKLRRWDRDVVDDFKVLGAWPGYAEDHFVTLDFGDRLARFGPTDPLVLYLAGWVEFPFSATNYAAATAGVKLRLPTIERLGDDGAWREILPNAGLPDGSPKMMTLDMTGKLGGPRCVLRIRTNAQVYWDQIFAAPVEDISQLRVHELAVADAELAFRGHLQEYSPDGRAPTLFDYHRVDATPMVRQAGRLTRYGDVRELLTHDDDRFVIFGAGDDLTVEFDATALPELPAGWRRSFVLRTWGYCKSADPLTAHADTIEPLPFRGMSGYPFRPHEKPADSAAQDAYHREFNTRVIER